ncbi:hypothetical protein K402DRAFT_405785 [Aulographum hederae CBS 113979]|uniref:Uncharacterized protein n=1 Tax=Aulographum hederae CBS 113979 TaxID=1176131 RepID=A0A6G1GVD8_9PEZI|nr:hypothetical protein K402DRAFT_405785 [Aulographum hederae CBS 113979]
MAVYINGMPSARGALKVPPPPVCRLEIFCAFAASCVARIIPPAPALLSREPSRGARRYCSSALHPSVPQCPITIDAFVPSDSPVHGQPIGPAGCPPLQLFFAPTSSLGTALVASVLAASTLTLTLALSQHQRPHPHPPWSSGASRIAPNLLIPFLPGSCTPPWANSILKPSIAAQLPAIVTSCGPVAGPCNVAQRLPEPRRHPPQLHHHNRPDWLQNAVAPPNQSRDSLRARAEPPSLSPPARRPPSKIRA